MNSKKDANIDDFLKYILRRARESYLENPFPTDKDKNELVSDASKKLEAVAKEVKERRLNEN